MVRLSTPGATLAQFLNFAPNQRLLVDYERLRMSHFICNDPHNTGYSALSAWNSTLTIKSHGQNPDLGFYREDYSDSDIWIYMPIDNGEYITAIFARLLVQAGTCMDIAIIVSNDDTFSYL